MKSYFSLTVSLLIVLVTEQCQPKSDSAFPCHDIQLNNPFTAHIGEEWCIPESGWKINFGPVFEDSRCNVTGIDCVWAGRFVLGATLTSNGESLPDTFYAVNNWQDTIYHGPYAISLNVVKPEIRATTTSLDPSLYSFEIIVR